MGKCKETAGFLFAHLCDQSAAGACSGCGRPICPGHTRQVEALHFCITCYRKKAPGVTGDPFLISQAYYEDYDELEQFDRFTAADARAFEEGPSGWEERWDEWEDDFDAS